MSSSTAVDTNPAFQLRWPHLLVEFVRNVADSGVQLESMLHTAKDLCEWRCTAGNGHPNWTAKLANRTHTTKASGCPVCARQERHHAPTGLALADLWPHVAQQFVENLTHPGRGPEVLREHSEDECVWKCPRGHRWQSMVATRTRRNNGCPRCKRHGVSRFEVEVAELLVAATDLAVKADVRVQLGAKSRQMDIHIPAIDLYVDLDPLRHHNNPASARRDALKMSLLRDAGIDAIRIRQRGLPLIAGAIVVDELSAQLWVDALASAVMQRGATWRTLTREESGAILSRVAREWMEDTGSYPVPSALDAAPHLALEFKANVDRPGLGLEFLSPGCEDMCRWQCEEGHRWDAIIINRVKGHGCRKCANKVRAAGRMKPAPGESLLDREPEIAKEFVRCIDHPELTTADLKPNSGMNCEWRCSRNSHTWEGTVDYRRKIICPDCPKGLARPGKSLLDVDPEIASFFLRCLDEPKLTAADLLPKSSRECEWECRDCRQPFTRTVAQFIAKGNQRCSDCSDKLRHMVGKPTKGSLLKRYPSLAAQFVRCVDEPEHTAASLGGWCKKTCEWRCPACGHMWQASPLFRVKQLYARDRAPCPRCAYCAPTTTGPMPSPADAARV